MALPALVLAVKGKKAVAFGADAPDGKYELPNLCESAQAVRVSSLTRTS